MGKAVIPLEVSWKCLLTHSAKLKTVLPESSEDKPYKRQKSNKIWINQLTSAKIIAMLVWSQAGNPRRNRYEQARNFVPPGRLMFLRPIKSAAKERRSNRQYKPVWITAQVNL